MEPEVIDGIKCYAPEKAFVNDGFDPDSFNSLYQLEENNFWFRCRTRIIKSVLTRYLRKNDTNKFLEIGCGTGIVLKGISKPGYHSKPSNDYLGYVPPGFEIFSRTRAISDSSNSRLCHQQWTSILFNSAQFQGTVRVDIPSERIWHPSCVSLSVPAQKRVF